MHRLQVTTTDITIDGEPIAGTGTMQIELDGLALYGVTQMVIHMSDGKTFAHLTLPVHLELDAEIGTVRTVRDGYART